MGAFQGGTGVFLGDWEPLSVGRRGDFGHDIEGPRAERIAARIRRVARYRSSLKGPPKGVASCGRRIPKRILIPQTCQ